MFGRGTFFPGTTRFPTVSQFVAGGKNIRVHFSTSRQCLDTMRANDYTYGPRKPAKRYDVFYYPPQPGPNNEGMHQLTFVMNHPPPYYFALCPVPSGGLSTIEFTPATQLPPPSSGEVSPPRPPCPLPPSSPSVSPGISPPSTAPAPASPDISVPPPSLPAIVPRPAPKQSILYPDPTKSLPLEFFDPKGKKTGPCTDFGCIKRIFGDPTKPVPLYYCPNHRESVCFSCLMSSHTCYRAGTSYFR